MGGLIIKNKSILIAVIALIFFLSIGAINAQDTNQTDSLALDDTSQPVLESDNEASAFLVLDNDASEENIYIGDYVTWIIEVQNFGPDTAKNVKVFDKLPSGLKYIKHTLNKGTFNPDTGIWEIGDLDVEEGIVTLLITTKAVATGEQINEAYITSDTINSNNETFEEEEIDVFDRDSDNNNELNKPVAMHITGNPIFLILASLLIIFVPVNKK